MKQVLMGNHMQMLYEVGDMVSVRVELLGQTAEWIGKVVNRHEAREPGVYFYRVSGHSGWLAADALAAAQEEPITLSPYIMIGESQGQFALDLISAGTEHLSFSSKAEAGAQAIARGWRKSDSRRAFNRFERCWVVGRQVDDATYRLLTADGERDYVFFPYKRHHETIVPH